MKQSDWVRMESGTMRIFCERCGDSYQPALPCPIQLMADMAKSFVKSHAECEEKLPNASIASKPESELPPAEGPISAYYRDKLISEKHNAASNNGVWCAICAKPVKDPIHFGREIKL